MHQAYFLTKSIILLCRSRGACPHADMPHVLFCYVICIVVDHQLLNVDNRTTSRQLNQIRNIFKYIGYSCLNKEFRHIYICILGIRYHKYCYKHVLIVNM